MGIDKELQRQGYEYDDREAPAEIWINRKTGLGFRLKWFWLRRWYHEHWNTTIGNSFVESNMQRRACQGFGGVDQERPRGSHGHLESGSLLSEYCDADLSKKKAAREWRLSNLSGLFTVLFFLLGLLCCFLFCFFLCHSCTSMKNHSYLRTHPTSPVSVRILVALATACNKKSGNHEKFLRLQVRARAQLTSLDGISLKKELARPNVTRYHLYW